MRNFFDEPVPPNLAEMVVAARRIHQAAEDLGLFEIRELAELLLAGLLAPGSEPRK